jgi:hypothetical protein
MQKPYAPKYGQQKTKIDLFRDFFTKIAYVQITNFISVKVSTLYRPITCGLDVLLCVMCTKLLTFISNVCVNINHNSGDEENH